MKLQMAQIGRCGELLLQYELLLLGVESAPMSTDAGVDLVAYSPKMARPATIQVKTNLRPKPSGGRGKSALDGWIPDGCPAGLIALVDLSARRIWLLKASEIQKVAQQKPRGRYHVCMSTDRAYQPQKARLAHDYEFQKYLLANRASKLFGV